MKLLFSDPRVDISQCKTFNPKIASLINERMKTWNKTNHHLFPNKMKKEIKTSLMVHLKKKSTLSRIPKDILFEIFKYIE